MARLLLPTLGAIVIVAASGVLPAADSKNHADRAAMLKPGEWPQFLGPQRDGLSTETGLLDIWPVNGPKTVWRATGGVGKAGLAIAQGRLVTVVQREGKQWLIALNVRTGEPQWKTALAPEYRNAMGDGPRATPTIAGDRVFVYTGEGILAALRLSDGKLQWTHNIIEDLHAKPADYGMACSPLVHDDRVIVTAGAAGATVVAIDTVSGKTIWTAGDDPIGYSSPTLLDVGGRQQLVVTTGTSVLGLVPTSGVVLWRFPYPTEFNCNIANPLAFQGQVFISSGENHGSVMLALKPNGDKFDVEQVWASQGSKSTLRCEWQTAALLNGNFYGFDNVGSAGPVTHFTCVDAASGARVWQQLRFGKGNLIAADGKLLISTMEGEFVMLRATPKAYEEIGRTVVLGSTRTPPALAGGLLYLRDDREIVCLDVRK